MTQTILAPERALADLTDQQLSERLVGVNAELLAAREQWQHWQQTCGVLADQARAVAEEQDRRRLAAGEAQPQDWRWLLEMTEPETEARYKAAKRAVGDVGRFAGLSGLGVSGYNPRTMQRVLKVSLYRDRDELTEVVLKALQQVLPVIEPTSGDDREGPYKYVGVFEASLSEHGSYHLAIDESRGRYELRVTRYGRPNLVHAAANLGDLLKYVQRNCYYETGSD